MPLLIPLLSIVAGILLADISYVPPALCAAPLVTALAIGAVCMTAARRSAMDAYRMRNHHRIWLGLAFLSLGMLSAQLARRADACKVLELQPTHAVVRIDRVRNATGGDRLQGQVLELIDRRRNVLVPSHEVQLLILTQATALCPGDIVTVHGQFRDISTLSAAGAAGHRDGPQLWLFTEADQIKLTGHSPTLATRARQCRDRAAALIERSGLNHRTTAFVIALLLGDRDWLDPEARETFSASGLAHIMSLSGLHIGILATVLLALLYPLNLTGRHRLRLGLTVVLLWAYALLTGMGTSTVRACIMATAALCAIMMERRRQPLNFLFLATSVILLCDPAALWSPGLQLSFCSVAGILVFSRQLNPFVFDDHPRCHKAYAPLAVTMAATLATWPLVLHHFDSFPTLLLPANLLVLPFMPAYVMAVPVHLALDAAGLGEPTAWALDNAYKLLESLAAWTAADGNSLLHLHLEPEATLAWCVFTVTLLFSMNSRLKRGALLCTRSLCAFALPFAIGLTLLPTRDEPAQSLTVDTHYDAVRLTAKDNNQRCEQVVQPGTVTRSLYRGYSIVCADGMPEAYTYARPCNMLIVGRNCPLSPKILIYLYNPQVVLAHSMMLPRVRERLERECELLGIPFHSLAVSPMVLEPPVDSEP